MITNNYIEIRMITRTELQKCYTINKYKNVKY